jgi:hypothetical protein
VYPIPSRPMVDESSPYTTQETKFHYKTGVYISMHAWYLDPCYPYVLIAVGSLVGLLYTLTKSLF